MPKKSIRIKKPRQYKNKSTKKKPPAKKPPVKKPPAKKDETKEDKKIKSIYQNVNVHVQSGGGGGGSAMPTPSFGHAIPMQFANTAGENTKFQQLLDIVKNLNKPINEPNRLDFVDLNNLHQIRENPRPEPMLLDPVPSQPAEQPNRVPVLFNQPIDNNTTLLNRVPIKKYIVPKDSGLIFDEMDYNTPSKGTNELQNLKDKLTSHVKSKTYINDALKDLNIDKSYDEIDQNDALKLLDYFQISDTQIPIENVPNMLPDVYNTPNDNNVPLVESVFKKQPWERIADIKKEIDKYKLDRSTLNDYMNKEGITHTYSRMTEEDAIKLLNHVKQNAYIPSDNEYKEMLLMFDEDVDSRYLNDTQDNDVWRLKR